MSMYEIAKFMVYKFTIHCIVYSELLLLTDQSVTYYTFFTVAQPISELLHFFHYLHVQEKPVTTLIGIYFTVGA